MKIFLNMKSKNGSPVLVSLLQYMKKTTLENPEILVKDERIEKRDAVVQEVKESEEWEEVRMSWLSVAMERGMAKGMEKGMEKGIEKGVERGIELTKKTLRLSAQGLPPEEIASQLGISPDKVRQIIE